MQLITKVHLYRKPYTICCITEDRITLPDSHSCKSIGVKCDISNLNIGDYIEVKYEPILNEDKNILKLTTTALFLQPFLKECVNSNVYRKNVITYLNKVCGYPNSGTVYFKLILVPPDKEIIDYAW